MNPWDTFAHDDAYDDLKIIVQRATSMGARTSSYGERKLTIEWPDGCVVHIRRFVTGRSRWLIFTESGRQAVFLSDRDPNLRELRGSGGVSSHSIRNNRGPSAGFETTCLGEI
jgi:hypothetical protein